ncbi:hypothetical protein OG395_50530 [Streptomyces sp. NBC_01320]|nr:hypothetical protein OG395_50530 [Streptomyces sp. NBC_01320]
MLLHAGPVLMAGLLDRGEQVLEQMPTVRDLQGARGRLFDGLGVGAGAVAVAADDLRAGVGGQPRGEGLRGSVGQYVDDTAALHIDQDRPVAASASECELIHAEHPRRAFGYLGRFQKSQEAGPAGREADLAAQALTGSASELGRYRPQPWLHPQAGPPASLAEALYLLDESPPLTPLAVAEEPPDPKPYRELLPSEGQFGERSPVGGMDSTSPASAVRAAWRAPACRYLQHHMLGLHGQPLQLDVDSGEQRILDHAQAHEQEMPQGNDSACTC